MQDAIYCTLSIPCGVSQLGMFYCSSYNPPQPPVDNLFFYNIGVAASSPQEADSSQVLCPTR